MTDKQKNLIVRSITGVLFVVCMVSCFLNPRAMIFLFTIITGLSIWEYCGLVNNEKEDVTVNRLICTIAGVYFFLAVAGLRMGIVGNFIVFVPYLLTIVYLFISELYTGKQRRYQRLGLHHALADVHRPAPLYDQYFGFRILSFRRPDTLRHAVATEYFHIPLDKRYRSLLQRFAFWQA